MAWRVPVNLLHLRQAQRWSTQRVRRSQLKLLARVISRAAREVPLYRKLYRGSEVDLECVDSMSALEMLPILTKDALKAGFPDQILSENVKPKSLYPIATSGTSDRVMLFHDEFKRDWDRAADLLLALEGDAFRLGQRRAIIPADACYERCGADEYGRTQNVVGKFKALMQSAPGHRGRAVREMGGVVVRDFFWRMKILQALGVEGTAVDHETLQEYVSTIDAYRPHVLAALPLYLYVLARHLNDQTQVPKVPLLRPAGGKLSSEMIRQVEKAFRGRVRENYGTAELGTVAFDCSTHRKQHLLSELFMVEFLRAGRPVGPGELGELVITDLRNHVAPLIRYAIGDVGRYEGEPCWCGRSGLLFTVDGCMNETIVAPEGRAFRPDRVLDFFLKMPGVAYAKLIQISDDRFRLEGVPSESADAFPSSTTVSNAFGLFLGYPVSVDVRIVHRLAPEPSGKYRLIESRSHQRFHDGDGA